MCPLYFHTKIHHPSLLTQTTCVMTPLFQWLMELVLAYSCFGGALILISNIVSTDIVHDQKHTVEEEALRLKRNPNSRLLEVDASGFHTDSEY